MGLVRNVVHAVTAGTSTDRSGSPTAAVSAVSNCCWKQAASLRGHGDDVMDLAWSHDDAVVMSGSVDNEVMMFDVDSRRNLVSAKALVEPDAIRSIVPFGVLDLVLFAVCTGANGKVMMLNKVAGRTWLQQGHGLSTLTPAAMHPVLSTCHSITARSAAATTS